VWSKTQSFTTPDASGTVSIGVLGDARDTLATWQLVNHRMRDAGVALQLIDGDVVLAGAEEAIYQQWLDGVWQDGTTSTGFLTLGQQMMLAINGNHENDVSNSFSNWALPGVAGDAYAETYASFDLGSVHFVMLDDNSISTLSPGTTVPEASAQLAWLDADLKAASADRANHPFIVAMNHRGVFSTSLHSGETDVLATRAALAPLFDKYKVDLVINGHDHEYERSKPLKANTSDPRSNMVTVGPPGTTYVVCAGAGAAPYAVNSNPQSYSSGVQVKFCQQGMAGCTSSDKVGAYTILEASPASLKMTAYALVPSATTQMDDPVIDTLTLTPQ
jgi:predicted phosphodiesterase